MLDKKVYNMNVYIWTVLCAAAPKMAEDIFEQQKHYDLWEKY